MGSSASSHKSGSFVAGLRFGLPARRFGVRLAVVHLQAVEQRVLRVEAAHKILEAAARSRGPAHFGQRQCAWKREILDVLPVPDEFAPNIALRAEDVLALRGGNRRWDGVKTVNR